MAGLNESLPHLSTVKRSSSAVDVVPQDQEWGAEALAALAGAGSEEASSAARETAGVRHCLGR